MNLLIFITKVYFTMIRVRIVIQLMTFDVYVFEYLFAFILLYTEAMLLVLQYYM